MELDICNDRKCYRAASSYVAIFHTRRELHYLEPSPAEWHLHRLLEPFKNSTEILSGHYYPTLSCLGPILAKLKEELST